MASAQDNATRQPNPTQICEYDDLIKAEAQKIGWDWRLLASIIYQESHFKPDLVNHKGAFGLMQLMPLTMKKYNITHESSVEEQLEAGGKLLVHLDHKLSGVVTDSLERVNFVLASYNAGMSRVMNFREQALQNGNDPNVWADNVELYSPKQTILFVKEVTERFAHYKTIAK
jgi:membrane-bound lytic murein transglycosylase F